MFILKYILLLIGSILMSVGIGSMIMYGYIFSVFKKGYKIDLAKFNKISSKYKYKLGLIGYVPGLNIIATMAVVIRKLNDIKKDPEFKNIVWEMNYFDKENYDDCKSFKEKIEFISSFVDEEKKSDILVNNVLKMAKDEVNDVYKINGDFTYSDVLMIDENAVIGKLKGTDTAVVNVDSLDDLYEIFPDFQETKYDLDAIYDVISLKEFNIQELADIVANISYMKCKLSDEDLFKKVFGFEEEEIFGESQMDWTTDEEIKKKKTL